MGNGGKKMLEENGEGEEDKETGKANKSIFSSTAESLFLLCSTISRQAEQYGNYLAIALKRSPL